MSDRSTTPARRHIPALDGLRGLAVAAVVVYHAWPSVLPGGWIGVSVFFTLSGFLITTILVRDHALSRASLADFWRRRARRLLPAALVTIAATVAAVALIDPAWLTDTAEAALAATLYVHNWWSAGTTDGYWEIFESAPSPLAHMWSLAIEEQVYIVWPLVVLAAGLRRALFVGAAVVVAGTWFWWGEADAYYATPFRFGEVVAGAVVAALVLARPDLRIRPGVVAGAAGVTVWLTTTLGEADRFVATGALTVIAVCAAVVTAWSATAPAAQRLLGSAPLGWFGRRSYAIYLFHWPLLVLLEVPPAVAVALTLVLAEASHRVLEWPIRTGAVLTRPVAALGSATLLSVVVCAVVIVVDDEPDVAAETAAALEAASTSATTTVPPTTTLPPPTTAAVLGATDAAPSTTVPPTTTTTVPIPSIELGSAARVMLFGDSTGFVLRDAVEGWAQTRGGTASLGATPICSPVHDSEQYRGWATGYGPVDQPCRPEVEAGTDLVVIVDHGVPFVEHEHLETGQKVNITDSLLGDAIRDAYESTIAEAGAMGAEVLFVSAPLPFFPELIDRPEERAERMAAYRELILDLATRDGVHVLDVGPVIDADPDRYPRSDGLHLDEPDGAINFVVDLLAPVVEFGVSS